MPPQILFLVMQIVPGLMQLFVNVIIPIAGQLLTFTIPRLVRIPLYLRLLWTIYTDSEINAEARKYLTSVLLVLGSILTFMTYSYIPLTGVPIIGALTTPIAAAIAIIVSLVSLDGVLVLNKNYLIAKYPQEFESIHSDVNDISTLLGQANWDNIVKQTQSLLDAVKGKLDPNGNYNDTLLALINALNTYLWNPESDQSLSPDEINHRIVTDGLPPFAKYGGSVVEGALAGAAVGAGAHGAAAGIFVQAGFLTGIKAALGIAGGIVVAPSVFTGLVIAAPIGLAAITGLGVIHGASKLRDEGEKQKLSAFLADILIAALPMAWIDGEFSTEERDTIEKLMHNAAINEKDMKRVRTVMKEHKSFDDILHQGLLKEENPQKARMKYRLLLCTAYELAKADGAISSEEINLHNRMAQFMNIKEKEVHEIRRLILLKSGFNIHDCISVIQGNITEQAVDVVVNSTNSNLLPGNKLGWIPLPGDSRKVDTIIHRGAGSELQKECQSLKGCSVGEVKMTTAHKLLAKKIIHTVTPIWQEGDLQSENLLVQCYRNSLMLCYQEGFRTIAFPALGTGTGKFPIEIAAKIAITEILQFLNTHFSVEKVNLVCLDESIYQIYLRALEETIHLPQKIESLPVS
ncbi:MAG: macro domain-containing protein [Snowella sp.]|nr:macro domain-containing protein [Snowella sp.]